MQRLLTATTFMLASFCTQAADGIITLPSAYNATTTADRLVKTLQSKGMNVFARIDHAQGAVSVNQTLRPTELVIFGNPKVGTPLMQCAQSVAIDLPQKALIWEDAEGKVWLSYNDPGHLAKRHAIKGCDKILMKIRNALANFAKAATQQ